MQWLIGEVDVRISGLKRVCTEKTMCRTLEVPREREGKRVNENSLERVILPQNFLWSVTRGHEELLKVFKPGGTSKCSDIKMNQRFGNGIEWQRKGSRSGMNLRKWGLEIIHIGIYGRTQYRHWTRNQRTNNEGAGWTQNITPVCWAPAVAKLCRERRERPSLMVFRLLQFALIRWPRWRTRQYSQQ